MTVIELLSLAAVLLLALYGCACMMIRAGRLLLRPREPCLQVCLSVKEPVQNCEQLIRYAVFVAKESSLPLSLQVDTLNDEDLHVIERVCAQNGISFCAQTTCEDGV